MQQPKVVFLEDYKSFPFEINSIDLVIDILPQEVVVFSTLKFLKKIEVKGQRCNLELNGEGIELLDLKLNGEKLPSNRYQLSSDKLVILNIEEEEFILNIENKIDPYQNKALEGFYQSGPQLCTQCEPEGFRRITYFVDRPDMMAIYTTKMIADKIKYPFLLSNGNRTGAGDLPGGRHWVEWADPFRKPSYLFAMVAGDFDVAIDTFVTMSGRRVNLEIYVDRGNLFKTSHAMESLKQSMKWDEETFGLEYDLDIYMIVAVDSFNMGAMENKGLNIFNSACTLADQTSATDGDFQKIQAIIGHEYFHNWTGNRVTCRDWFQLTLKEGLTVFRDQEFSADMLSRAVKRLEDVKLLKEMQFSEDSGPLSHPIRPSSYIEINNFYTRTIYEKGAEVIRMIHTLIGKEKFRLGMDLYFKLFDGKAVTTEDFIYAMESASGKDLTQFKNWYSRPGTPTLIIKSQKLGQELIIEVEQKYPPTTHKVPSGNVLHMPFLIGLIDSKNFDQSEILLEIGKLKETFRFPIKSDVVLSLNREFSAPVLVDYDYQISELLVLMAHDENPYSKYDATQKVYDFILKSELSEYAKSGVLNSVLTNDFKDAFSNLLHNNTIDLSFKSYLLELPSENSMSHDVFAPDFDAIHLVRENLKKKIGLNFQDWFLSQYKKLSKASSFELTPKAFGERALKNQCLSYLVCSRTEDALAELHSHYSLASNMTEEVHALELYVEMGVPLDHYAIEGFYKKWKHDSLVMLKWFGVIAAYTPKVEALSRIKHIEKDPLFFHHVPNYFRSLYLSYSMKNLDSFHDINGSGYKFLADKIIEVDALNPQLSSRAAGAFSLINKLDPIRKKHMEASLKKILDAGPSKDTFEIVSKFLAQ